ncbi:hypothetical protein CEXT_364561 [Caerostris extrusa]|uniref:Uncharacterized protein n=1 Tax=Caerostris extrusa TaxID=172846 RepID=A0AAV4U7C8_CAEEX|nr:hypothetical protein CEXT_364561 [Caerostris extrusa]
MHFEYGYRNYFGCSDNHREKKSEDMHEHRPSQGETMAKCGHQKPGTYPVPLYNHPPANSFQVALKDQKLFSSKHN